MQSTADPELGVGADVAREVTDVGLESVASDRAGGRSGHGGSGRRMWWFGLGFMVLVVAISVVGVTRVREGDAVSPAVAPTTEAAVDPTWQPGPCPQPQSRADMTPEEQAASSQRSREAVNEGRRTGWLRFRGERGDGSGWFCGWMRYFPSGDPAALAASGGKEPLYDAPDGAVIGYSFAALGVFTPEQVAAPGFDPAALRVARYGCDPVVDKSCRPVFTR